MADVRTTIMFLRNHEIIHLDSDFFNVLTDGTQAYLTDFGLALDKQFALTAAEQQFYRQNSHYDYGQLLWSSAFQLYVMYCALPETTRETLRTQLGVDDTIEFEELLPVLLDHIDALVINGSIKLDRHYVASLRKYRSIIDLMHNFYTTMRRNNKKDTQFRNARLQQLLKETNFTSDTFSATS